MKRLATCLVLLWTCASLPVLAEGGYIGASWLSTAAEFDTAVDQFDLNESGWKVFAGFDAAKFFGSEISYRDMGSFSDVVGGSTFDADIEAWDFALRGVVPLGRVLNIFGKIGYAKVTLDGNVEAGAVVEDISFDDWELMYGLGAGVNLGQRFGLRAEWEEFDTSEKLNTFSAGFFLRF